jgi:NADPH-dependent 2,4-dienoyl-CoA reductase/sulfur reductase-like enzyme
VLPADVVLVGIGVDPATSWLEGSGLGLRNGVVCDETLQATDVDGALVPGVYAAGDVARWPCRRFGEELRVEHWTNAAEQGAHAAESMLAAGRGEEGVAYDPVPFVWSDQGALRIQVLGHPGADDDVEVVAGSADDGKLLALYSRDGRLRGVLGLNAPRWVMPMRQLLLDGADLGEARAVAVERAIS